MATFRIPKSIAPTWSALGLAAILGFGGPAIAQTGAARSTKGSPAVFVREFLAWYVPRTHQHGSRTALDQSIRSRPAAFCPALRKAIIQDLEAQKQAENLVGIDFDAVLGGQDPEERYVVGKIVEKDGAFLADIHGVRSGSRNSSADSIAEVVKYGSGWCFRDFIYPEPVGADGRLSDILERLARYR